jgi:ABC-type transport system involved in multi-copper enzyme maturation permease subunit
MRQAIHILKKDARQFRYEIAAVLLLLTKFGYDEVKETGSIINSHDLALWQMLLPVAWTLLVVRAIQSEALPGDRQFWITRPYDRRSLLAAKMLFLLTFISLPLLLTQAFIVVVNGYELHIGDLLWNQILLVLVFILPSAALASVTATLPQFVLGGLAFYAGLFVIPVWSIMVAPYGLGMILTNFAGNLGPLDWIQVCAQTAAAPLVTLPILVLQFMRRKTTVSRIIAITGTVLGRTVPFLLPWGALLALEYRANPIPSLHIELDRSKSLPDASSRSGSADLPLSMTGLPEGTELKCDVASVVIEGPQGVRWRSDLIPAARISRLTPSGCVVRVPAGWSQPVKIRASLYLTLFGNKRSTILPTTEFKFRVPGLGLCSFGGSGGDIACGSPFRWPERLVWTHDNDNLDQPFQNALSYSPFSTAPHIGPIETFSAKIRGWNGAAIAMEDPLVHFRYDFEADSVHLEDFPLPTFGGYPQY